MRPVQPSEGPHGLRSLISQVSSIPHCNYSLKSLRRTRRFPSPLAGLGSIGRSTARSADPAGTGFADPREDRLPVLSVLDDVDIARRCATLGCRDTTSNFLWSTLHTLGRARAATFSLFRRISPWLDRAMVRCAGRALPSSLGFLAHRRHGPGAHRAGPTALPPPLLARPHPAPAVRSRPSRRWRHRASSAPPCCRDDCSYLARQPERSNCVRARESWGLKAA
jgi:hypothetical protein